VCSDLGRVSWLAKYNLNWVLAKALAGGKVDQIMKKFQIMLLALVVVSAFGAVLAGSASAEITLLAEWLAGGAVIAANLPSATTGAILLEDTKTIAGPAAVICKATLDGTVGSNGADTIAELLTPAGVKVEALPGKGLEGTGAGTACVKQTLCAEGTTASPIIVWPVGLPWTTTLFLMENGTFLDRVVKTGGGVFGYELLCLVGGINVEDECTSTEGQIEVTNDAVEGAGTPSGQTVTPNATCTMSKEATGVNQTTELAKIKLTEAGAPLLSVSSEGAGE
jgi:hypothetical protein